MFNGMGEQSQEDFYFKPLNRPGFPKRFKRIQPSQWEGARLQWVSISSHFLKKHGLSQEE
jgi:hypothetical protein